MSASFIIKLRWPFCLGLLATLFTLVSSVILTHGPIDGDAVIYARMAVHPITFTEAPLGYRLLTPWLVHFLPFPPGLGFWLITVLALIGTASALGLLCHAAGLSRRAGVAAAILFLVSYGATFDLIDYRLVDPLAYLGTTLLFLFLARHRAMCAATCILATTVDKEWGLFLIVPFVAFLVSQRREWTHYLGATLLGIVAPLTVYWMTRHWPGFGTHAYGQYYSLTLVRHMIALHRNDFFPSLLDAWGLLWVVALWGWRRSPAVLRLTVFLLPPALLQLLFATDGARMVAYAFPCIIPLFLIGIEDISLLRWIGAVGVAIYTSATFLVPPLLAHVPFGALFSPISPYRPLLLAAGALMLLILRRLPRPVTSRMLSKPMPRLFISRCLTPAEPLQALPLSPDVRAAETRLRHTHSKEVSSRLHRRVMP